MFQMDVKSTLLNEDLKEEEYMNQSPGFVILDSIDKVYKLKKALYWLKQSPRAWYQILMPTFYGMGLEEPI